ncbi:hypothetical protein BV25DRAFT_1896788 [Artomyces pyxidatus]|uniref:Uncharacterized protein n=1 Tax=Artomyces pyxidatus TaxID=48021 RepID=A0ACB8THC3_9AGAM|nr:hypothetical protein BV25DRAFT_1896788 [Artomyces pyxidatus]
MLVVDEFTYQKGSYGLSQMERLFGSQAHVYALPDMQVKTDSMGPMYASSDKAMDWIKGLCDGETQRNNGDLVDNTLGIVKNDEKGFALWMNNSRLRLSTVKFGTEVTGRRMTDVHGVVGVQRSTLHVLNDVAIAPICRGRSLHSPAGYHRSSAQIFLVFGTSTASSHQLVLGFQNPSDSDTWHPPTRPTSKAAVSFTCATGNTIIPFWLFRHIPKNADIWQARCQLSARSQYFSTGQAFLQEVLIGD